MWDRLKSFLNPIDARFEDMTRDNWRGVVLRDLSAGLIVAMMAIPMAMGFAMAAGLRPENGLFAGAIAGIVGGLFGGSKYNVYGPVAALIPVIAGVMAAYATPADPYAGHGYLVLICMCAGPILILCALLGWGKLGNLVPHSIVVGFSVGIAMTIGMTQLEEVLGLETEVEGPLLQQFQILHDHLHQASGAAVILGGLTFLITHSLLKISRYIPAPIFALGIGTLLAATVFAKSDLTLIGTRYGEIPTDFLHISLPTLPSWDLATLGELAYYSLAFAFVCGFESLLCARMADNLAGNRGTPYDPDKEFWGQGLILLFVPLLRGMPLSGALARTTTKVVVGGVTPLSELSKSVLKLLLIFFLARYLEMVPMACIGGIMLWVAFNMVKPVQIKAVWHSNRFHAWLMVYTAVTVFIFGFLEGVLSATFIYGVLFKFLDKPAAEHRQSEGCPSAVDKVHPVTAAASESK